MQFRKSNRTAGGLVPLLLLGLTATAPVGASGQGKAGTVFDTGGQCRATLKCAVGETRIYDYSAVFTNEADVETVTESGYGSATLTGEAVASLTAVSDRNSVCTYAVALREVEVAEIVNGEPASLPRDEEISPLMEETYYFTQASDGRILDVMIGREEQPEAVTFKRGVINALNVTLRGEGRYEVQETDISGTHRAQYSAETLRDRTTLQRTIDKGAGGVAKSALGSLAFESTQNATLTLDHDSCGIAEVNINEVVIIDQPDASDPAVSNLFHHETLTVRAAANMTLRSTTTASSSAQAPTKLNLKDLVRLPVDAPVLVTPRSVGDLGAVEELLENLTAKNRDEEKIRELARALRADDAGMEAVRAFVNARQPTGSLAHSLGTLLIGVGTEAAQRVLAESLLTPEQDEETLERLIGLSTLIQAPTPGLVDTVSGFASESRTGLGVAANLALGAYAEKLRGSHPKLAADLVRELETRLRLAAGDDAIPYLRALGNAGAESSLPLILSHFQDSDRLIRLSSVIATRKIASPRVEEELLSLWARESSESVQQTITRVVYQRADKGLNEQAAAAKAVIVDWSWDLQVGGSFLNAEFAASALVEDEPYLVDLQATSVVNGPFGFSQDLLDVQLLTEEVNAQDRRFRFFIMLVNNEIANIDDTETCSVEGENTIWDEMVTLADLTTPPIPIIGPLTLNFDLDLGLDLGINFFRQGDWCTNNSSLQLGLTPSVTVTADGYATLTLWPFRGGLGIGGTLVGIDLPIYADATMRFQDAPEVCFTIDAQIAAADLDLYAWGQIHTIFFGWRPNPRPRWVLWDFDLSPEVRNLVSECEQNPDLNCIPDVLWWNGTTIDAWYDGANCYVASPPAGSQPFISDNAYFIEADSTCPAGLPWDGTGCREAAFNALPTISASIFPIGGLVNLFFDKEPGSFGPIPACPTGWTQVSYLPDVSRRCELAPPPGVLAESYFLSTPNGVQYTIYLAGSASCVQGIPETAGCFLGNAPGGTNAFVWSGNFYYSEP